MPFSFLLTYVANQNIDYCQWNFYNKNIENSKVVKEATDLKD